jgi:hypothetical protein
MDKIIEKEIQINNAAYKVVKYDDKYVCDNDETLGKYRSLILSEPEGRILCYSPPKSITLDLFKERNPTITPDIIINEVIEGTSISLFWDDRINQWEIATKGSVGGNYWFYRTKYAKFDRNLEQRTFRRMFLDALRASDSQDLNDLALLENLPKGTPEERICYNFILQHPDNHIVLQIETPKLYLISVYGIQSSHDRVVYVSPEIYYGWNAWVSFEGMIEFPSEQYEPSYDVSVYCSPTANTQLAGLMFTNTKTGDRTCIENEAYRALRELRGNNPNLQYQFLCLKKINKVQDFLGHFPQYKKIFFRFHRQYEDFITQLHQSYVSYYVKKEGKQIEKRYFPLIHRLHHDVYLPSLASEKIIMKRSVIKDHIVEIPPSDIIYYLNYEL